MSILPHVLELQRNGKLAEVWIDGKKKSSTSIEKETRRQLLAHPELVTATPSRLPTGVIVKECSYFPMQLITTELPFHDFEKHLHRDPPVAERHLQWDQIASTNGHRVGEPGLRIADKGIEKALQLVVPDDHRVDDYLDFSLMNPDTRFFASPLHRNILFSVANNFAGIDSYPKEQVILFLQRETSEVLYRMIRSAPHYYATQAIALNIFRAAIEVGDARIVDFLLKESLPGLGVNGFICSYHETKYTPVERAAGLLHTNVVKTLLDHGADINLSHPNNRSFACKGAFDFAARGMGSGYRNEKIAELDPELFALLVNAGGQLDSNMLKNLIKHDSKGDFTRLLISFQAAGNHREWSKMGIFLAVFRYQSHQVSSDILDVMLKHRVDLNYHVGASPDRTWPRRVIDIVAERGNSFLMQKLLREGVQQTGDTLPCAISSGNEELVHLLLQHGSDVNSVGDLRNSPLAASIRLQRASMSDIIACNMDTSALSQGEMFQSALRAASEVGDLKWIKYLVNIGGDVRPADLGTALKIAAKYGKREVALALIDAGADTNISSSIPDNSPALLEALSHRDPVLIHALLNADANPNYEPFWDTFSARRPAIELAVLWGDMEIVKTIIRAGADVNACCDYDESEPALNIAVQKKDYDLLNLLLKAGCDVNNPRARILDATALKTAVKTADIAMVRYVLAHGADVHDPAALVEASKQSRPALDILLDEHNARYPKGRPCWGTGILYSAIESDDFCLFQKLLNGGADANHFVGSTTPLGHAIHWQWATSLKFVEYLLQKQRRTGCTPESIVSSTELFRREVQPRAMVTAFLAAIGTKSRPMIDLMLRYHADVDFAAAYGVKRTPLQRATELGSIETIELLLEKGANVNSPAAQRGGGTALQLAAMQGFIPIARLLLEKGAEVDAPASKVHGRTALEGAAWKGRLDMVTVLLKAGAALHGTDQGQIARAIAFAQENSHVYISELLDRYRQTKTLSSAQISCEEYFDFDLYAHE